MRIGTRRILSMLNALGLSVLRTGPVVAGQLWAVLQHIHLATLVRSTQTRLRPASSRGLNLRPAISDLAIALRIWYLVIRRAERLACHVAIALRIW